MKVRDFCNREVVVIERGASVAEAAKLMRQYHVGSVIVIESGEEPVRPTGVLTDRDIVLEFVAQGASPEQVSVGDAMSNELVTISEHADLFETIELMRDSAVRRIPVVDDEGALVGLVASDDALELVVEQLADLVAVVHHQWRTETNLRPGQ